MTEKYIIVKRGAYYRPNAEGYTGSAIAAGRYSLEEAISHSHPNGPDGPRDGMSYMHEDIVTDEDWIAHKAALATQEERIAKLEAAINDADSVVTVEINPSNYDHDGVCLLNDQMVEAFSILTAAMKGPTHDG